MENEAVFELFESMITPSELESLGWITFLAVSTVGVGSLFYRFRNHIWSTLAVLIFTERQQMKLDARVRTLETLLKKRTHDLKAAEKRFSATFGKAAIGIAHVSLDGRWIMVNPKLCDLTGYSEAELLEKTFADITHPDDLEADWSLAMSLLRGSIPSYEIEKRYIRKDGTIIWVKLNAGLNRDDSDKPEYFIACVDDITERKRLQTERNRLYELPNHLLCVLDEQSNFKDVNEGFTTVLGFAREELVGHPVWNFIHPDDINISYETAQRGKKTVIHAFENRFRTKSGDYKWLRWTGTILDGINYGAAVDITELKKTQESLLESKESAERANMAKTQFLANMSHEIRTPIGAIVGFSDLLRNSSLAEAERAKFMRIIERNSQQLLRLIDDILDLSKVEAGKLTIDKTTFSFVEFLAELCSVMKFKAAEKGIEFHLEIDGLIPDRICSDQTRLKQILMNLIGNAIKFTDHGHVKMIVRHKHPRLEFHVRDTGLGISAEQKEKLFKPFGQADSSLTRKYGGTGLGLVLACRLSEALGGHLALEWSDPGKGSCFFATIEFTPVAQAKLVTGDSLSVSSRPDGRREDPSRLQGLRVLVVDDSPDNRTLVESYLRKTGAEVILAEDGREAIEQTQRHSPGIVLMDIQMPIMDGHEAIRVLRASGFTQPIIALTAHAMREERERCFESGCTDYLTKPLKREQLIDVLSHYHNDHEHTGEESPTLSITS